MAGEDRTKRRGVAVRKLSLLALVLMALIAGTAPAAAITGGNPDGGTHPNVGAIVVYYPPSGQHYLICSGTLVGPTVFLTAGHCTHYLASLIGAGQLDTADVSVSFSSNDALNLTNFKVVEQLVTHPDYNPRRMSDPHDVGVLILEGAVTLPEPEALPDLGYLDQLRAEGELRQGREGAKFTVVGYGSTLEWPPPVIGTPNGVRRSAESEYLKLLKPWLVTSQNWAKGDGGTCFGDSGGPVFYSDNGDEVLVAITSWGDNVCVATGFNYRVDIADTLDFIEDFLDG